MTDLEIDTFIEIMEEHNDFGWTHSGVKESSFGDESFEAAVAERLNELEMRDRLVALSKGLL